MLKRIILRWKEYNLLSLIIMPKSIIYCHYAEENEIFYIAKLVSFVAILVMPFVYLGLIYCVASIL